MSYANLIPVPDNEFNPFFFDEPQPPVETYYKIYHDGGHYIATRCGCKRKTVPHRHSREDIDILFDSLYTAAMQDGLKGDEMTAYIKAGILLLFPDYPALDKYIAEKIERKLRNLYARKKRFRRKANLNRWNYFVTFTYADGNQDEYTFRKKLRKCLSNLHTRRGWRYMGVFECATRNGAATLSRAFVYTRRANDRQHNGKDRLQHGTRQNANDTRKRLFSKDFRTERLRGIKRNGNETRTNAELFVKVHRQDGRTYCLQQRNTD